MISLQFSLDYELFGDGSGSVYREQINPTSELLDIFDEYGAKLTIYFEIGQYLAFEKLKHSDPDFFEANKAIEEQLKDAVRRGHDVQLHLHPTWLNANYENGTWQLDIDAFDITSLELDQIVKILSFGKKFLEELLKPVRDSYECIAFRAGAWSANDNKKYIQALEKSGFFIDSTVVKGAFLNSNYGKFDFRSYDKRTHWKCKDSLNFNDEHGKITQVPIMSLIGRKYNLIYLNKKRKQVNQIVRRVYKTKVTEQGKTKFDKLVSMISRNYIMADFNFIRGNVLFYMLRKYCSCHLNDKEVIPVVFIGHSKTSYFNGDIVSFFKKVEKENDKKYVYHTISEFYKCKEGL
ncbi:hypothetical protein J7287_002067 [Vibrio parahaemolyticus]|uniref:hypothetical protein n=1 Tax=Vibrio parahaemolyticus TaxID=670 RepID=UPI0011202475|nr:hypothetical protein [Vibrio parahaemolyticus]EGQ8918982.1 hypothetical protein [Vibrio parahaemolyticus]EHH3645745.1 hypothetical protein [Vibrio parahaemolyticus]EHH3734907.1 hypothetical protein [Vibrio parahaemolyticus]EHR1106871.1 hypothetical protein [Vibrio parahaemolyticus]EJL7424321.1 hypothetical protein [Vibrio parahaemolyticus]